MFIIERCNLHLDEAWAVHNRVVATAGKEEITTTLARTGGKEVQSSSEWKKAEQSRVEKWRAE